MIAIGGLIAAVPACFSFSVINMGKFGSFRASELIGLPFDMPYEVYADKKAKPAPRIDNLDAFGTMFLAGDSGFGV